MGTFSPEYIAGQRKKMEAEGFKWTDFDLATVDLTDMPDDYQHDYEQEDAESKVYILNRMLFTKQAIACETSNGVIKFKPTPY